jgi:hypothetical protein
MPTGGVLAAAIAKPPLSNSASSWVISSAPWANRCSNPGFRQEIARFPSFFAKNGLYWLK